MAWSCWSSHPAAAASSSPQCSSALTATMTGASAAAASFIAVMYRALSAGSRDGLAGFTSDAAACCVKESMRGMDRTRRGAPEALGDDRSTSSDEPWRVMECGVPTGWESKRYVASEGSSTATVGRGAFCLPAATSLWCFSCTTTVAVTHAASATTSFAHRLAQARPGMRDGMRWWLSARVSLMACVPAL